MLASKAQGSEGACCRQGQHSYPMAPTSEAKRFTIFPINTNDTVVGKENSENRFCQKQAMTLNVLCLDHFEPTHFKRPLVQRRLVVLYHDMKIRITPLLPGVIKQQSAASSCKRPSCQNTRGNCINHWLHINKFMAGGGAV